VTCHIVHITREHSESHEHEYRGRAFKLLMEPEELPTLTLQLFVSGLISLSAKAGASIITYHDADTSCGEKDTESRLNTNRISFSRVLLRSAWNEHTVRGLCVLLNNRMNKLIACLALSSTQKMQAVRFSQCRWTCNGLHDITFQKTAQSHFDLWLMN
jgi:hypothetical protein